jgi:hypothetical protein
VALPAPFTPAVHSLTWASSTLADVGMSVSAGNFSTARARPYVLLLLPAISHAWPAKRSWLVSGWEAVSVVSVTPDW